MSRNTWFGFGSRLASLLVALVISANAFGQGIYLTGVGPVNRSMGSAGTAAPLDSIGSLYWNPGSISGLPTNEVSFGMELLLANIELGTTIAGVETTTNGEAGASPIPSIGWVHHLEDSPITVGLGLFGVAGFKNNMPRDAAHPPLLSAGPAYAAADLLQIMPTVSYAVSDQLSIGFSPMVSAGTLTLDPVLFAAAVPGQGNRLHWGGGFQAGVYYIAENCWHIGFTYKSQQWFEDFRFFVPAGTARFDLDYPAIMSLGLAYTGKENWVFAIDARYFNYENTPGFREFGFSNIFAGALGAQYHLNDCWYLRFGYNFNQNPLHANDVATNVISPLTQEQNLASGVSYRFAENVDLNMAYVYLVENSLSGPGLIPGSTMTHRIDAHSGILGVTVRY